MAWGLNSTGFVTYCRGTDDMGAEQHRFCYCRGKDGMGAEQHRSHIISMDLSHARVAQCEVLP